MREAGVQIDRFVPELARRRLSQWSARPLDCRPETFSAAVVFADVSGFTRLGQSLASLGDGGAERLTQLLNTYYGALIDLIYDHGGDVVRFAGDALLAVWPVFEGDAELAAQIERATQCCLAVQERLHGFLVANEVRLSLRMSVAAGELTASFIGGVDQAWQLAVLGQPLDQLRRADALCAVGAVLLSPEAAAIAGARVAGQPLAEGHLRALALLEPAPPIALRQATVSERDWNDLRRLVPTAVLARIDAGQGEWLADLLRVTVVFLRLTWLDRSEPPDAQRLHEAMQILQQAARQHRGTVLQLMIDDKGTVGIVSFGLPPFEGEHRARRALAMVEALLPVLSASDMQADIGIADGEAFCGPLGSSRRQQYTVMGNVMNLAARLMQHANHEALCEEELQREAADSFTLQPLPRFSFKGFDQSQAVFRLQAPRGASQLNIGSPRRLIGRNGPAGMLHEALEETLRGENADVVVEGEAGIGKSALLRSMLDQAAELGMAPLLGECSLIEQSTPYYPWRMVFTRLLDLERCPTAALRESAVLERLPAAQHWRAALLNPLLGLDFPETQIVGQMSGATRANNLHEVLIELLRVAVVERGPLAILLDDMHWADWTSWQFASLAIAQVHPLTLGLFLRTLPEPHPPAYPELLNLPGVRHLKLELLTPADVGALVRDRLGIDRVAPRLIELVFERSQGNPLFAEEMLSLLRENGSILVTGGVCDLIGDQPQEVPRRVSDLITSRTNQLPPPERLTLQVASVVGKQFLRRLLGDVYPVPGQKPQIDDYLGSLERNELVRVAEQHPETTFAFRHGTIQQVIYSQLPLRQRTSLHRAIAGWYEATQGAIRTKYPLLAWHWGASDDLERELKYLDLAGDEALRNGAGREAIQHFQKALARLNTARRESKDPADLKRRVHWTRLLGEANFLLGDLVASRRNATQALDLLGRSAPKTGWRIRLSTLWQVAVQLGHRLRRLRPRKTASPLTDAEYRMLEAALASHRISQICYFTNEVGLGIERALTTLNLAERVRESPVLAVSYANMSIIAALLRVNPLARVYARLAKRIGHRVNDLPALAYTLIVVSMYWLGRGAWSKVRDGSREASEICEQLGDQRQLAEAATVLAMLTCFRAEFGDSLQHFDRVRLLGEKSQNVLHRAWGHCGRGECLFRLDRPGEAIAELEAAGKLLENRKDRTEEIRVAGLLSILHWQSGNEAAAIEHAEATDRLIAESGHVTVSTLEGVAGAAEVRLRFWQQAPQHEQAREQALRALRKLQRFAGVFPVGLPRALRLQGVAAQISGHVTQAQKYWQRSLQQAQQLGLQLEERLTRAEIARA